MVARGFKPVGWVAAVAAAALSCYMLSLRVASERAELAGVERQIIAAKQNIRSLQTELGTRGRLTQLEQWNSDVLALSAPASAQYLDSEVTLARFDSREKTLEERSRVVMAAQVAPEPQPRIDVPVIQASAPVAAPKPQPMVHQASYARLDPIPAAKTAKPEAPKPAKLVADKPKPVQAKLASLTKPEPNAAAKPEAKKPVEKATAATKPAEKVKLASAAPSRTERASKPASLLDAKLTKEIGEAAKAEKKRKELGTR